MANWYGAARSNYFHVKDDTTFLIWVDACNLDSFQDNEGRYAIAADFVWPSSYIDEHGGEFELDLPMELSTHLAEGQVAVLMEVGNEKLRYLTGYAVAVNSHGDLVSVDLNEIYKKAALAFGTDAITRAEY